MLREARKVLAEHVEIINTLLRGVEVACQGHCTELCARNRLTVERLFSAQPDLRMGANF